jgi:hypothetical protein
MTKAQKILLVVGILGVAIGGFFLTKYLTRNTIRQKFVTAHYVEYDTPPIVEPIEE